MARLRKPKAGEATRWWRWIESQWRSNAPSHVPAALQTDALATHLSNGGRTVFLAGARMIVTIGFLSPQLGLSTEQIHEALARVGNRIDHLALGHDLSREGHDRAVSTLENRLLQSLELLLRTERGQRRALEAVRILQEALAGSASREVETRSWAPRRAEGIENVAQNRSLMC